jgi:hypothetical protein
MSFEDAGGILVHLRLKVIIGKINLLPVVRGAPHPAWIGSTGCRR